MSEKDAEVFYARLKEQLSLATQWPSLYPFKFIVPSNNESIEEIKSFFVENGTRITTKQSKNGKYTSISITALMDHPETVIKKYKEVSTVKGIISL